MNKNINIYIDGLFYRASGIGRYYESLTKEFAKRGIKIYTCVPRKFQEVFHKDFKDFMENINPIFVDYEKFSLKGMIEQNKILKNLEDKVDLFFYPHINLPIYIPQNTIITIHDLRLFTKFWDRSYLKKNILSYLLIRSMKKSRLIITISKTVEEELKRKFSIDNEKIVTIYRFIDDKFADSLFNNEAIVKEPYILFVGNRKKHKNISNLIKAFYLIKDKIPHKLIIAGSKDIEYDEVDTLKTNLKLNDRIIEFISPDDDIIINLYQHADLFVFPSLFEGFGLPPLEAISCGTPVIASNIPVLREILGEEIACFDPYDIEDVANKILYGINNKDKLFTMGKERLKLFDKEKIITQYINIFNEIKGAKNENPASW